jgi:hypothetical protein
MSVPINRKHKLGTKTIDFVFLGYAFRSVGYKFLNTNSGVPDMLVGAIMESRDATFFRVNFLLKTHKMCLVMNL